MKIRNFTDIKTVLFNNKTVKQTIFKNTLWIAVGLGVSKFLGLVLIIYVARILGATEYGKFTFALAFISLFVMFSNFGLPSIITREFSGNKEREKEFSSILSLKILLSLGALFLILISSFFVTDNPGIRSVIWILALFSLINGFSEIIFAFFRARQRMEYESLAIILKALAITAVGFFVILNFPAVKNLSYGYLFSAFIGLVSILIFFHFKVYHLTISFEKLIWQRFLAMSWPLALTGLFGTVYVYIDSVMMGYWGQITETGWYNAAYKIAIMAALPMGIIAASFFPALSKIFKESKEKLQSIWNFQMELMIILALPLTVGGAVLGPKIINFIYNSGYTPSILAFQILIIMVGIIFLSRPLEQILIVSNQQKKIFWATFFGASINIILNLILIPKFSLYGAAIATVITFFIMLFSFFYLTLKFTPIRPLNLKLFFSFTIVGLSSIVMYFVVSRPQIYNLHISLSIFIGIFVYCAILFSLKLVVKYISRSYG